MLLLTSALIVSCGQTPVSKHPDKNQLPGVDSVTVYQDDPSDSIPKDKIIYQTAWANTPDSLKPKFNIGFCNNNFRFPYYFPKQEQLIGPAGQTITKTENTHLQPELRTSYYMVYDNDGKIIKYNITGPSTIYLSAFVYDDKNRIKQILNGKEKINITYNNFDNIETIVELNEAGQINKTLRFIYTYVALPRH